MKNQLDPHYNDFGGLDTATNKLKQDPKACREGSKNMRFDFQDQLRKRNGFQHKNITDGCSWALMEYKYSDINSGQSLTQILGISEDGNLNKLNYDYLELTVTSSSLARYYSFIYDEAVSQFRFVVYNSLQVEIASTTVTTATTLDQLETAINAFAITGFDAEIVDENGTLISSSRLAYLMDTVYMENFNSLGTDVELNGVPYWTQVPTAIPGSPCFTTIASFKDDPLYEGPTWVNENNSIYITDGGWLFKYDGFSVYRAGMPNLEKGEQNNPTNSYFSVTTSGSGSGGWDVGTHAFKAQLVYKDPIGAIVYGVPSEEYTFVIPSGGRGTDVVIREIQNDDRFPIYSCQFNGAQSYDTSLLTNQTLNVDAGHNLLAGMNLRLVELLDVAGPGSKLVDNCAYVPIVSVTATTITLGPLKEVGSLTLQIQDNQVMNGVYISDIYSGRFEDFTLNTLPFGPSLSLLVTKEDDTLGTKYRSSLTWLDLPATAAMAYTRTISETDASLEQWPPFDESVEGGADLPRACRYITTWQNQLVQAGRPYDAENLILETYPTAYNYTFWKGVYGDSLKTLFDFTITEAGLCDFQSVYWTDTNNQEGFPQSGLNEEDFNNFFADEIRGMGTNKEALFVFKERTTAYITGTLADGNLVKEFLEADVGAVCHKSIQNVSGAIVFMDRDSGFWSVITGRLPVFIGEAIEDQYKLNNQKPRQNQLNLRRAVATNFKQDDQYLCYIPAGLQEIGESGVFPDPSAASRIFAFDYAAMKGKSRNCWYLWDGINCAGGILATSSDELLFSERTDAANRLWKQKRTGSKYDFSDHTVAIEFDYRTAFLNYGKPIVDKRWVAIWVNSIQGGFTLIINQFLNYIDTVVGGPYPMILPPAGSKLTVKMDAHIDTDKASALSVGLYNNDVNADVSIQGFEVQVAQEYDTGEGRE